MPSRFPLSNAALMLALLSFPLSAATPIEEFVARMTPAARAKITALGADPGHLSPRGNELARAFLAPLAKPRSKADAAEIASLRAGAADLLANRISLLHGYEPQALGFPYDWFRAPQGDLQWPTHLSRHYYLHPLAQLYTATGDRAYAGQLSAILLDWVKRFPIGGPGLTWRWKTPPGTAAPASGEATFINYADGPWTSLSAHARVDTWLLLLPPIAPALDNEATAILLNSLLSTHRRALLDYPRTSTANQFLSIGASLVNLANSFPDFEGAEECRRIGVERVTTFATTQIYPDGSVAECSPNYGLGSVSRLQLLAQDLEGRGTPLPPVVNERVRAAVRYYALIADPLGRSPRIAKGGAEILPQLRALNREPADPQVAWLTSAGKEGSEPARLNYAFDWAGHFVFRSGWDRRAIWLFFEPGPRGSGHHDLAQLGVQVVAGGATLLADPGYYSYSTAGEEGRMSAYLHSTAAHNTALVDGQGQVAVTPGTVRAANRERGHYSFAGLGEAITAAGIYRSGFGDKGQIAVEHHRRVQFAHDGRTITIEDSFTGAGTHRYDILWQVPPKAKVEVEGTRATITTAGATATLDFRSESKLTVTSASGTREPYAGWYSETYGQLEPATTLRVSLTSEGAVVKTSIRISDVK